MQARYSCEGTNRAWDERPLCHVVPCRAFSTPRGVSARCANCGSGQRLTCCNVVRVLVVLNVILGNAFATLRGTKARYAGVIPSKWFSRTQLLLSHQRSRLVPSLAFYQCSRPTRACSGRRFASSKIVRFSAPVSATIWRPSIGSGAAKAQPVGPRARSTQVAP